MSETKENEEISAKVAHQQYPSVTIRENETDGTKRELAEKITED